ncbi:MAG: hypothetical protein Q7U54_02220 [Bacteroidales bacterium]|nr:hypothetical protein [Bacteroidales bacterium]
MKEKPVCRRDFLKKSLVVASGITIIPRFVLGSSIEKKFNQKFNINVYDRMYDCHRPKGCTVIAIEYADWPGNEFGLWLPESISVNEKTMWANWREDAHQDFTLDLQGRLTWKYSKESFELISTLTPDEENSCLWYRHTFRNKSDKPLSKLSTQTCFHLVNAPQFISIKGERLWACLDGKWTTTDKVPRYKSPDPRRIGFLKEGVRSERTVIKIENFLSATMAETAHHPLFIAESFGATASVGVASRNFRSLFNNNDSILRCIHSEAFPIEKLMPGETVDQEAVILFCKGNYKVLLKQFEKLKSKNIES